MKKILLLGILFIGFFSIGLAADYAIGCNKSTETVSEGKYTWSCDYCEGTPYIKGNITIGTVGYFNKCCESGIISDSAEGDKDKCCDTGETAYVNDKGNNKCCEVGNKVVNNKCVLDCDADSTYGRGTSLGGGNNKCCDGKAYDKDSVTNNYSKCCERGNALIDDKCVSCSTLTGTVLTAHATECSDDPMTCLGKMYKVGSLTMCCDGVVKTGSDNKPICIINTVGDLGINMNPDCLINGQCSYNIYETLGIRKSDQNPTVLSFVQDIVLAITMFIGTVVAIVLVVSGILYIMSSITGNTSQAEMAKKGIVNSMIGLLFVVSSYAIVRLVQFLATAGGG